MRRNEIIVAGESTRDDASGNLGWAALETKDGVDIGYSGRGRHRGPTQVNSCLASEKPCTEYHKAMTNREDSPFFTLPDGCAWGERSIELRRVSNDTNDNRKSANQNGTKIHVLRCG